MNIRRRELLRDLEENIGYLFENSDRLDQALTHKSFANEAGAGVQDNERLEFLGDAALDLAVSQLLYEVNPKLSEGEMSKIRAYLVKEESLHKLARSFNLGRYLLLGKGEKKSGGMEKPSILADALEALIAAIYIDGGFHMAFHFIEGIFRPIIAEGGSDAMDRDYKTKLQELCQTKYGKAPTYKLVSQSGPDHEKIFEVEILIGNRTFSRARGRSKKEAEQNAAQDALEILN